MLDENCTIEVSDFGTSRVLLLDCNTVVTSVHDAFGYLGYHTRETSRKSDVYRFEVINVVLLIGNKPSITNDHGKRKFSLLN